jgi:hypothetical protein
MRSRHSVEQASYGADLTRVLKWVEFYRGLVVLIFVIVECGYPYTIGTDRMKVGVFAVSCGCP